MDIYGTECTSNSTTWDSWLLDRKWATIPGTVGTRTSTRRTVATSSSTTVDSGYLDINYPGHLLPRPQLPWTVATWKPCTVATSTSTTWNCCYLKLVYLGDLNYLSQLLPWPQLYGGVGIWTLTTFDSCHLYPNNLRWEFIKENKKVKKKYRKKTRYLPRKRSRKKISFSW